MQWSRLRIFWRKWFRRNKENLLSLYNAVNGTGYTDVEEPEMTT